jgi:histidinol-phosphate phosphatase family protein
MTYDIVVPTLGRASLGRLLDALAEGAGPRPGRLVLVDDRRDAAMPLLRRVPPASLAGMLRVIRGAGAGPAAARNVGWRATRAPWVAFLDDDVVPAPDWAAALARDLCELAGDVGGSQGRIVVPLPAERRATDWERNVQGLERARWATADMAYRRAALEHVDGFDETFTRAYREDADLALRVQAAGWRLVQGRRVVQHPVRPADRWVSVRLQAGNADDPYMRARHGRDWRRRAGVPRGRRARHLAITAAAVAGALALALRRRRLASVAGLAWLGGTVEFAWARMAPGPRTMDEIATMAATSVAIPPVAAWHWLRGWARVLRRRAGRGDAARPAPRPAAAATPPRAVLLDRDGTLVVDVPYNGDPTRVRPVPGARAALDRLRAAGVQLAVVSNQSGVGRGLLRLDDVDAVNRRIESLLGPLGPWLVCPHAPADGCSCRKPSPGLVLRAAATLGVRPEECVVIGDTGADVEAARAAGARGVLVPNSATLTVEVQTAPEVAADLPSAVARLLGAG